MPLRNLLLATAAVILLAALLSSATIIGTSSSATLQVRDEQFVSFLVLMLKNDVEEYFQLGNQHHAKESVLRAAALGEIDRIAVIDDRNNVLFGSRLTWQGSNILELFADIDGTWLDSARSSRSPVKRVSEDGRWLQVVFAFALPDPGPGLRTDRRGAVYLRANRNYSQLLVRDSIVQAQATYTAVGLLIVALLVFVLYRSLVRPINLLTLRANSLANDAASPALPAFRIREFQQLADALTATEQQLTGYIGELRTFNQELEGKVEARTRELNRAQIRLQTILDSTMDGLIVIDRSGIIETCNAAVATMFGYDQDELLGQNISLLMTEPEKSAHDSYLAKYQITSKSTIIGRRRELRGVKKSGRVFPLELSVSEMEIEGRLLFAGAIRDITRKKIRQARLVRETRRIRDVLEGTNAGLWDYNYVADRFYISKQWAAILGYTIDDLIPLTLSGLLQKVHAEDSAQVKTAFERLASGKTRSFDIEFRMKHRFGHWAWINSRASVVETVKSLYHRPVSGMHIDISRRKQAEMELVLSRQKALAATEAKSNFLANMSHEIRTPMNAIIGMTNLVLKTDLTDRQRNFIEKANLSAEILLGVINDILDFSKIEAGKLELAIAPFSVAETVDNAVNLVRLRADEKAISIAVSVADDIPERVLGDYLRLTQILVNLLSNAVKYTDAGGRVTVACRVDELAQEAVRLQFAVTDTGIGLCDYELKKLFQPFSQADSSASRHFGGTGLGLSICRQLVNLMHGDISAESEKDKGSTFSFHVRLDLVPPGLATTDAPSGVVFDSIEDARARLRGAKILLAEDNLINQELTRELLAAESVLVRVANNGREALKLLEQYKFDAVLMDCQMPVMDGYQTARAIRNKPAFRDLPIIAMTANAMKGDREKVLEAGMSDYLAKPIDGELLFVTLASWIGAWQSQEADPSEQADRH